MTDISVDNAGSSWRGNLRPDRLRTAWLSIDGNERALAWSQGWTGIVVIHVVFIALLAACQKVSMLSLGLIGITLAALAAAPAWRWPILGVAGVAYFMARPLRLAGQADYVDALRAGTPLLQAVPGFLYAAGMALVTLGLLWLVLRHQRANPGTFFARRPVLSQIVFLFALIAIATMLPIETAPHTVLWTLISILGASFFFFSYLFADERARAQTPQAVRLGFVRPFWGGSSIPFKSPSYLARFEARDPVALSRSRLKALKLIVWAAILHGLHTLGVMVLHLELDVPTLRDTMAQFAQTRAEAGNEARLDRTGPGVAVGWAALISNFVLDLLYTAVVIHAYVAIVRMTGFCIPRGMARPLSSRSIAEFWNRYLFYFKEVLVDFFFYPAFARYFKNHPRLRVAFATFCAAFVGNILFSVIWNAYRFGEIGPAATLMMFQNYVFYAALLTVGLIASQLITRKPRPEDGFWRYDVLPRARVVAFFLLCSVFVDEAGFLTFPDRFAFVIYLFIG